MSNVETMTKDEAEIVIEAFGAVPQNLHRRGLDRLLDDIQTDGRASLRDTLRDALLQAQCVGNQLVSVRIRQAIELLDASVQRTDSPALTNVFAPVTTSVNEWDENDPHGDA